MGGYGSGRRSGKRTTGDMWRLTIFYLHKRGLLTPGRSSSLTWSRNGEPVASIGMWAEADHIVLKYRTRPRGGKWEDKEYPVFLDWTACHLGGQRGISRLHEVQSDAAVAGDAVGKVHTGATIFTLETLSEVGPGNRRGEGGLAAQLG